MEKYRLDREENVSSSSLYLQVVDTFRQMIHDGVFSDGDKLPAERELAEIFGVSRIPLREAMKVLEYLGVLQHIRGKGVYVRRMNLDKVLGSFDFLLTDPDKTLSDLFDVREALEIKAVALAAKNRTEEDVFIMEEALEDTSRCLQKGRETYEPLLRFHNGIFTASKNVMLEQLYRHMSTVLYYSRKVTYTGDSHRKNVVADHEKILECIKNQDVPGAVDVMYEHLAAAREVFENT